MSKSNATTEVDVLVVGSGAGAMTAALRARHLGAAKVLLIEKSDRYGGSSAMSGGCIWIPNNRLMAAAGIADSDEDAHDYVRALTAGEVAERRIRAALRKGREMVDFLLDHTEMALGVIPDYPDYYPEVPGARRGGRSLEALPFHGSRLGDEFYAMRESHPQMRFGNLSLTFPESRRAMHRRPGWRRMVARLVAGYLLDVGGRRRGARDRRTCLGAALVARLRMSLLDRGIPLWLDTAFQDLITADGRVIGVAARSRGRDVRILAARGVVLAAGGFERNQAMRERYLPSPTDARWSTGNPHNTGDVMEAGVRLGAATAFMDQAWWGPTNPVPGHDDGIAYMFVVERSVPGGIVVNRHGVRVVNESAPYSDIVRAMYETRDPEGRPSVPLYLIVDAAFRRRFAVGPILPGQSDRRWRRLFESGFITRGQTLEQLARSAGIDADALARTVEAANRHARTGVDPEFHRGDSAYDACWSDPKYGKNPCLGEIGQPPFYAVALYPGDIGTRGGLLVDEHARVIDTGDRPIAGLYAIGNCSAPVYGSSYPGAGATLGPAMTFGFVAADHAMAHAEEVMRYVAADRDQRMESGVPR